MRDRLLRTDRCFFFSTIWLGQRVYEQSLPILRAVDDLMKLTRKDAAPTGTLRFGISQAIGDVILADAVEQLSGEFPTLDIRVRAGWGAGLAAQVGAGDLDAAIVMLPAGSQLTAPLIGRTIATVDVAIVQSRRRPLVHQLRPPRRRLGPLLKHGFGGFDRGTASAIPL